ncbi:MAG: PilZ domain-containing protein [Candidatus Thiodiazotropha sp. DIVDIV]
MTAKKPDNFKEHSMQDKRHTPRKVADQILELHDKVSGSSLGRLVNISAEGLMLLSQEPMIIGSVFQLSLVDPQSEDENKPVEFSAEVVWCAEASQPDSFWSGFRIHEISNNDILYIDKLILNWYSD